MTLDRLIEYVALHVERGHGMEWRAPVHRYPQPIPGFRGKRSDEHRMVRWHYSARQTRRICETLALHRACGGEMEATIIGPRLAKATRTTEAMLVYSVWQ